MAASLDLFPRLEFPFTTHQQMSTWEFENRTRIWVSARFLDFDFAALGLECGHLVRKCIHGDQAVSGL